MCPDVTWYKFKNGTDQKAVKLFLLFQELIMEDYLYGQFPSFHHYAVREQLILSMASNNLGNDTNMNEKKKIPEILSTQSEGYYSWFTSFIFYPAPCWAFSVSENQTYTEIFLCDYVYSNFRALNL